MKILIVSATNFEIKQLLNDLIYIKQINSYLSSYKYNDLHIDVLITGIGMIFTIYRLTKILSEKKYDLAINAGIAGSFSKKLKIGKVVNITKDEFSDLGIEYSEGFYTLFDKKLVNKNDFPFKNGVLINERFFKNSVINKLLKVSGITVNTAHCKQDSIEKIKIKFKADIETMEGAAFFYVCMYENISFLQIRAISNYVEQRNEKNWNIPLAVKNLSSTLIDFFSNVASQIN